MMRKVELFTEDGHFVATVEILPFPDGRMPRVVTWGIRIFVRAGALEPRDTAHPERPWAYNECFSTASITPSPGFPRETVEGLPG